MRFLSYHVHYFKKHAMEDAVSNSLVILACVILRAHPHKFICPIARARYAITRQFFSPFHLLSSFLLLYIFLKHFLQLLFIFTTVLLFLYFFVSFSSLFFLILLRDFLFSYFCLNIVTNGTFPSFMYFNSRRK